MELIRVGSADDVEEIVNGRSGRNTYAAWIVFDR